MSEARLPWVAETVLNRIAHLVEKVEARFVHPDGLTLAAAIADLFMERLGERTPDPRLGLGYWIRTGREVQAYLDGMFVLLRRGAMAIDPDKVADMLNEILIEEDLPVRYKNGGWCNSGPSQADELLCQVLVDRSEVAGCHRGDVQVEMVASSAQVKLGEGTTIVDYGAGLGRVGDGLSTAREFTFASYVAVDDPIQEDLRRLVNGFGDRCAVMDRAEYLAGPLLADVVLVVNTLHHVPFADIPRQLGILLRSLDADGILVVHEMGTLEPPEQKNLPWRHSSIVRLLECDGLSVSPRETRTRGKGVPLAHVIARVTGSLERLEAQLADRTREVWHSMKSDALRTIRALYERGVPERAPDDVPALRRAMIHNANLDLNLPSGAGSLIGDHPADG